MSAARAGLVLLALAIAATPSCRRNSGGDDDDSSSVNPAAPESYAVKGSTPPIVVTLNIAFAENVSLATLQNFAAKIDTANQGMWNVTEGQIRIGRIRLSDNAHPGSNSNQYAQLNLSGNDIVVWAPGDFNGPGIAYVLVGSGRYGRFMGVPSNIANTTILHEFGHFLFELTWSVAPVLVDEYEEDPTDTFCLMELAYGPPLRWCWTDNHQSQPGQPHSCWSQILIDYPDFDYAGLNLAPNVPPAVMVEYTDNP
jgi:hypothetical protein